MHTRNLFLIFCACSAPGELLTIEVIDRGEILNGRSFGGTGAYEMVRRRARFAIDPSLRQNAGITEIGHAPRNGEGLVKFSADTYVLKPRDPARGNGSLLLEVPNRVERDCSRFFIAPAIRSIRRPIWSSETACCSNRDTRWFGLAGNMMCRAAKTSCDCTRLKPKVSLVWSAASSRPTLQCRFSLGDSGHPAYLVDETKPVRATVRDGIYVKRRPLDPERWRIENRNEVVLSQPAVPGSIYEVVYHSSNPVIAGLGLAATRSLFFGYGGKAESVLDDQYKFPKPAIGFGTSQSAMVLKAFLDHGFNEDEQGREVFDGIFANVAGGRRAKFQRFAQLRGQRVQCEMLLFRLGP